MLPLADGQVRNRACDLESIRRFPRHPGTADDIDRLGAPAAIQEIDLLVPVGVEIDASLLAQHALIMLFRG